MKLIQGACCAIMAAALSMPISASMLSDATELKMESVPVSFRSEPSKIMITATFDDLINRQFDIRMQQYIDKLKASLSAELLNQVTPVGYIMITVNPSNPSTLGFVGSWMKLSDDLSLISGSSSIGSIVGANIVNVPLPAHNHKGRSSFALNKRFWTNTTGNHSHSGSTSSSGEHKHPLMAGGSAFGGLVGAGETRRYQAAGYTGASGVHSHSFSTNTTGNHNHYIDVNFGTVGGDFTTSSAGVNNATIDVRGKRMPVYMWKRIS